MILNLPQQDTAGNFMPPQEQPVFAKPKGNERRRLITQRTALVLNSPFYGLLAYRLKLVERPEIVTAGVDGKHLFYNPSYIAGLSDAKIKGLWAHEVTHCTNGHQWRRGPRDHEQWNWACDYAIDPGLVRGGFDVPNATVNPDWKGWSAEQIYPLIPKKKGGGGGGGSGGCPRPGQVLDGDPAQEHQQKAEWQQAIISAATAAKAQGKLPAHLAQMVGEWIKPRVNWKALLRRWAQNFSTQDYAWTVRNRRYSHVYMPGLRSETMGQMVLGVDTSASIGKTERDAFLAEGRSIIEEVRPEIAYVLFADAAVETVQEFYSGDEARFKPAGGGGTSFKPVFEWVEKKGITPACLLYFTDMFGDFPDESPDYPVLWVSTTDPDKLDARYRAPFGDTIHLDLQE